MVMRAVDAARAATRVPVHEETAPLRDTTAGAKALAVEAAPRSRAAVAVAFMVVLV